MSQDLAAHDEEIRAAALTYVRALSESTGGIVTRGELESFRFGGRPFRLVAPQSGIWKPAGFSAAISFLTVYVSDPRKAPYEDVVADDQYLRYKWQGDNAEHADNRALRTAMIEDKPLLYLRGVAPGKYVPNGVWIVDEERAEQQFVVAFTADLAAQWTSVAPIDLPARREYARYEVNRRLHQKEFRGRVLEAYSGLCAVCRLRHPELLDAAHIREDADGGEPIVPNGMAMCAIHHRAFDRLVLGITPTYQVVVRRDIMDESDGPTLKHAIQGLDATELVVPSQRRAQPDRALLEERYERFKAAS